MNYAIRPQRGRVVLYYQEKLQVTDSRTEIVDLFLAKHGGVLPGHVIDFALDIRSVIAELEEQLVPVSV